MENKYIKLADKLIKSNFRIYGIGNFDISKEELATLLEILIEKNEDELHKYYEKLLERLG